MLGLTAFIVGSAGHCYGSNGTETVYSFQYGGRSAAVRKIDYRLARDDYYIEFEDGSRVDQGRFISDDGKIVAIDPAFTVRDGPLESEEQ